MKNQNISHFRDIHVHAATVQEWNQDYNQLTAGTAESSLIQLTTGRCHVFREQINQRVVQHGVAPRGKMCFAVPITVPGSIRMQGREVDESSLFFLHGGEEFMFHMPMGMELLAITFERELFEQALAQTASAKEISQLLRQPVIRLPAQRYADARRRMLAAFSQALSNEELDNGQDRELAFEQAMLDELLQLMTDPACDKQQRSPSSTRSFIVEKCHRLATAELNNVPSVDELCAATPGESTYRAEQFPLGCRDYPDQLLALRATQRCTPDLDDHPGVASFDRRCRRPMGFLSPQPFCRGISGTVRRTAVSNRARCHQRLRACLNICLLHCARAGLISQGCRNDE